MMKHKFKLLVLLMAVILIPYNENVYEVMMPINCILRVLSALLHKTALSVVHVDIAFATGIENRR